MKALVILERSQMTEHHILTITSDGHYIRTKCEHDCGAELVHNEWYSKAEYKINFSSKNSIEKYVSILSDATEFLKTHNDVENLSSEITLSLSGLDFEIIYAESENENIEIGYIDCLEKSEKETLLHILYLKQFHDDIISYHDEIDVDELERCVEEEDFENFSFDVDYNVIELLEDIHFQTSCSPEILISTRTTWKIS
jgi:hypothetical protein